MIRRTDLGFDTILEKLRERFGKKPSAMRKEMMKHPSAANAFEDTEADEDEHEKIKEKKLEAEMAILQKLQGSMAPNDSADNWNREKTMMY
jgi:hypothetical protein